jgi:hypothetical protein
LLESGSVPVEGERDRAGEREIDREEIKRWDVGRE